MKNIKFQVNASIIICVLLVLLVVVLGNTTTSRSVLTKEFEEKLFYYTEAYAYQISENFGRQQETVDNMKTYVRNMFHVADYEKNADLFKKKRTELDKIIKQLTLENPKLSSVYFTFDVARSKGEDEIWYSWINGKVTKADYSDYEDMWEGTNSVTEASYYNALGNGSVWSDIYFEPVLNSQVLSYVSAVYDSDGRFIGVAGVDIKVNDILEEVEKINSNDFGNVILTDADKEYIIGNMTKDEYNLIRKMNSFQAISHPQQNTGVLNYQLKNKKMVLAYASLSNDWTLMVNQPRDKVVAPITRIQNMIITCAVIALIISIIFTAYYSKRKLGPIVHEYEEKDIFIHSQTRSAKLGEMLSNIAHQWKQPLNSMTINITNMSDDFHDENLDSVRFDDYIEKLKNTILNMSDTVDDFANFLKPDKKKESFSINSEIKHVINIAAPMMNKESIIIQVRGDDIWGYGFKNEYAQVLFNIISNAVDALKESGNQNKGIKIRTEDSGKNTSTVRIFNSGLQIPPHVYEKLFEPYFSTKSEGKSTGLGLYMSREIIENNMNGSIEINNVADGVECIITIPKKGKHEIS